MHINDFLLIVFNSTHHAIKFEKIFKENGIKADLIPVPREIKASCGLAAKLDEIDIVEVENLVRHNELNIGDMYNVKKAEGKKIYEKIS